jgi:hypothetical protein
MVIWKRPIFAKLSWHVGVIFSFIRKYREEYYFLCLGGTLMTKNSESKAGGLSHDVFI